MAAKIIAIIDVLVSVKVGSKDMQSSVIFTTDSDTKIAPFVLENLHRHEVAQMSPLFEGFHR